MKNNRIVYSTENAIIVFRSGRTTNKKISLPGEIIIQTYSFSKEQYNYVLNSDKIGEKVNPKQFFDLASSVCFDCPFITYGKCYTHKYFQFSGFLSMLRSIIRQFGTTASIEPLSPLQLIEIVNLSDDKFVRFGTYGEPTLIDLGLVSKICDVAKNWTGYTHQWQRKSEYSPYFMSSVHSTTGEVHAQTKGFRSFIVSNKTLDSKIAVVCPASKEAGYISNCSKCGLCSGTSGKGKKSVQILTH